VKNHEGARRARLGRVLVLPALVFATACGDAPPIERVQIGFRGTGMEQVYDAGELAGKVAAVQPPAEVPEEPPREEPAPPGTWENVQVLGDLGEGEFNTLMVAITRWVSPEQGCGYCHVEAGEDGQVDYASDEIYTKVVSRRMLRMTRELNTDWTGHVGQAGVNCWTCHRGEPVPEEFWYFTDRNQSLRHYLDRDDLRVQGDFALAGEGENPVSLKQTEYAYELMLGMSDALGVNCTYCHNSPRFGDWEESTPARVGALRGIRMLRAMNLEHLAELQDDWPAARLGPMGDGPKLQCASCHLGAYRPAYGAPFARAWSQLSGEPVAHPVSAEPGAEAEEGGASGEEAADAGG